MDQQSTRTDITVNVDGFWMLQALLDIRHVAPELRCRPYVSTDSNDRLNDHPGMAVMREQGIVEGDQVNEQVAARMRVLAAPDLEVIALLSRGKLAYGVIDDQNQPPGSRDIPDNEFRVVLARRGQHWVSAVRVGGEITVDDVAVADSASIASLVIDALESIHHAEPAAINAVNVPLEEMLEATKSWQESGFNVFSGGDLRRMGISAATVAALGQALSDPRCTPASTRTTPKARAPRCCRSKTAPAAASRSTSKPGPRAPARRGWPSARPPRSWSRWASKPCWTHFPTGSGKPTAGCDPHQIRISSMSCAQHAVELRTRHTSLRHQQILNRCPPELLIARRGRWNSS